MCVVAKSGQIIHHIPAPDLANIMASKQEYVALQIYLDL